MVAGGEGSVNDKHLVLVCVCVCVFGASISSQQHSLAEAICTATSLPASHLFPSPPFPLASRRSNA